MVCKFAIFSECTVLFLPFLVKPMTLLVQVTLKHTISTSAHHSPCACNVSLKHMINTPVHHSNTHTYVTLRHIINTTIIIPVHIHIIIALKDMINTEVHDSCTHIYIYTTLNKHNNPSFLYTNMHAICKHMKNTSHYSTCAYNPQTHDKNSSLSFLYVNV